MNAERNHRYLVVGGKDPAPKNNYYDTDFVVGPNGDIVFRQGKSVPIQFFKDGLPAPKQELWNSPWGKIGFCVCYDLSYTRVIDPLVKMGAQLIIVPTMDVVDWGSTSINYMLLSLQCERPNTDFQISDWPAREFRRRWTRMAAPYSRRHLQERAKLFSPRLLCKVTVRCPRIESWRRSRSPSLELHYW